MISLQEGQEEDDEGTSFVLCSIMSGEETRKKRPQGTSETINRNAKKSSICGGLGKSLKLQIKDNNMAQLESICNEEYSSLA